MKLLLPIHGNVHASFIDMRTFVARKEGRCNWKGNRVSIPYWP